jgi:hypothetical protein
MNVCTASKLEKFRSRRKEKSMQEFTNRVVRIAAVAAGLGLTSITAMAQQGSFTLPVPAHWGKAVLQPGEHIVNVPFSPGHTTINLVTNGETQMTMPLYTEMKSEPDHAYIHLSKIDGQYYVDAYQSANGQRYVFAKPKSTKANATVEEAEARVINVAGR